MRKRLAEKDYPHCVAKAAVLKSQPVENTMIEHAKPVAEETHASSCSSSNINQLIQNVITDTTASISIHEMRVNKRARVMSGCGSETEFQVCRGLLVCKVLIYGRV